MPTLSVFIRAAKAGGWDVHWEIDSAALGNSFPLAPEAVRALDVIGQCFDAAPDPTTRQSGRTVRLFAADALGTIGQRLFAALCKPTWGDDASCVPAGPVALHVRTDIPAVLNLPWELLPLAPGGHAIGADPSWSVYRVPIAPTEAQNDALPPGPLRVLFLAAAAEGATALDYEREEEALLRAAGGVRDVIVFIAEMGSVEELADRIEKFRPHVVHLSGHGKMRDDGTAVFCFEDERGRPDLKTAADLVKDAFTRHPIRMVFLNGCETAQAAVAGLCQGLVAAGVPLALGWAASVADDRATDFTETLYTHLAMGDGVAQAVAHARARIERDGLMKGAAPDGRDAQDMTFVLPHLYAARPGAVLYDRDRVEEYAGVKTEYVLLPNRVEGLKEGFIGRRREQQHLIPALREGEFTVVVLHGVGGQGKSTLATRIANRLGSGFRTLAVKPKQRKGESTADCARRTVDDLLDEFRAAFGAADRPDVYKRLTNPDYTPADKLRFAVDALNEVSFLLVVDNYEDVLDLNTRIAADPILESFYARLMTHLTHGSRVIITSRYLPENTPNDRLVRVRGSLQDFKEHDFLKFVRRNPVVDGQLRRGELEEQVLKDLYHAVGGTPRFLVTLRDTLTKHSAKDLLDELQKGTGFLPNKLEEYIESILGRKLYEMLSDDGQQVASRLAVSFLPVPAAGAAVAAELPADRAEDAVRNAAAYGLLQEFTEADPPLYLPPGLLSGWLSHESRLPPADATATHLSLAGFWREVYEKDRESEMRIGWLDGLDACRRHARMGDDRLMAVWAANRIADPLIRVAEWRRARRVLDETLEGMSADDAEVATGWHNLGAIDLNEGQYAEARLKLSKSLEIKQRIGNVAGEAATWHQLGTIDVHEGQYAEARHKFGKSLEIKQRIGDVADEAVTWHALGTLDLNEGQYAEARQKFSKSLEINQRIGNVAGEAATWHQLGTLDLEEGQYAEARLKLSKSLEIKQRIGDVAGEAATWHALGSIDVNEGKYAEARLKFGKALEIMQRIGDVAGEAATWHALGTIDVEEGKYTDARLKLGKALEIRQRIGDVAGEAATWHNLSNIDLNEGKYAEARLKFGKALEINQRIGDVAGEAGAWAQLGFIAYQRNLPDLAARLIGAGFLIANSIGHTNREQILQNLLTVCEQLGYDQPRIKTLLDEVGASYRTDRGQSLLRDAFPDTGSEPQ